MYVYILGYNLETNCFHTCISPKSGESRQFVASSRAYFSINTRLVMLEVLIKTLIAKSGRITHSGKYVTGDRGLTHVYTGTGTDTGTGTGTATIHSLHTTAARPV